MSSLQKLAENNKKYAAIEKKDRKSKVIIFIFISLLIYGAGFYWFTSVNEDDLGFKFFVLTKRLWLILMALTAGIGALFFSAGFVVILWAERFNKAAGTLINPVFCTTVSLASVIISGAFIYLAIILNLVIIENNQAINRFLMLGYQQPPTLMKMALDYTLFFILIFIATLFFSICRLPFKAKAHAIAYLQKKPSRENT